MEKFIKISIVGDGNNRVANEIYLNPNKIVSIKKVDNKTQNSSYGFGANLKFEKVSNFNYRYLIFLDCQLENLNYISVYLDYKENYGNNIVRINQDFENWLQENQYIVKEENESDKIKWT
jgi:hypothetical protein